VLFRSDIGAPSPVRTNEVTGTIAARDIGDARSTDHFYAFTGTPGDLLITVQSQNMNGDVDVFTASGLRPLMKFTFYAGSSEPTTKSIYLRQRQDLILRVEARSPNDDEASYRIHFGGSFAPIEGGPTLAEGENNSSGSPAAETRTVKKGRRVTSAGARIYEPPEPQPEVAAAPTPELTPEAAEATKSEPPKATTRAPRTRRPARGSKRSGTTTTTTAAKEPDANAESPATPSDTTPAEPAPAENKSTTPRRGSRRGTNARKQTTPASEPEPQTGPRLVIETNDGILIERYMSTVRRVTVENGVVVVTGKDGKVDRIQLANVVRMSISP